jgi:hypothetical protein
MDKIASFSLFFLILGFCSFSTYRGDNSIKNTTEYQKQKDIGCEKCKIEYARDIKLNIDNLTEEQISLFLCSFDEKCSKNVEFSQFSNKMLFLLMSRYPVQALKVMSEGKNLSMKSIQENLQSPISDNIDLKQLYKQIEEVEEYQEAKEIVLNSIKIAIEKYN